MKTINRVVGIFVLATSALLAACKDKAAVASPVCADLARTSDPARRAELLKKCPRSGPVFKPSEKKQW
ncbi:entry exclusion lipoprotein TrbK [Massilia sp. PWRC2]|uniref:entry exclusion lipoprotein TrbK n=1 Tax=Massilia sp. PWRC2 TaxID=2804626 RepID=UPI003CE97AC4